MAHNWELMHIYIECQTNGRLTVCHNINAMGVNHEVCYGCFERQNL
ncbi:MAG: hypothetical protein IJ304_00320 [Clostridia bacterium]|nr:hypothetical protein [Clostridia bacterium]